MKDEGVSLNQYMVAGLARAVGLDEGKKEPGLNSYHCKVMQMSYFPSL
jgi:hypothetical protein